MVSRKDHLTLQLSLKKPAEELWLLVIVTAVTHRVAGPRVGNSPEHGCTICSICTLLLTIYVRKRRQDKVNETAIRRLTVWGAPEILQ
jgi:hypothetical protein